MRRSVGLLVALAVVRGLLYAVIVPPWQAPDEPGHFEYVALVAELGHVPAREEVVETLTREINASVREHRFELFHRLIFIGQLSDQSPPVLVGPREAGYQKPLYYLLLAPLYKLVQTQPILVRYYLLVWVSIMMAAGVVFLAAQTARALFPDDPVLQLAIPALALFWPTQSYKGASLKL